MELNDSHICTCYLNRWVFVLVASRTDSELCRRLFNDNFLYRLLFAQAVVFAGFFIQTISTCYLHPTHIFLLSSYSTIQYFICLCSHVVAIRWPVLQPCISRGWIQFACLKMPPQVLSRSYLLFTKLRIKMIAFDHNSFSLTIFHCSACPSLFSWHPLFGSI